MQAVETDKATDWNNETFDELIRTCEGIRDGWRIRLHSSNSYWTQIEAGDGFTSCSIARIKIYITSKDHKIKDLYIGAVKNLLEHGKDSFASMVSKVVRDGTLCFFVSRHDYFVLEKYMKSHSEELKKGNPFIAHRGLLGISRDLMDIDSHNAQQAKMIWDYFQLINDAGDIDIEDMYRMFVLGWNAELAEGNPFREDFERATAQMFVLMMDSLYVLLGVNTIDDASLLLNNDKNIWHMLGDARCWNELSIPPGGLRTI